MQEDGIFGSSVGVPCFVPYHTRILLRCLEGMPHFFRLFLDLPTPTLSLLRDLQVGQSNSCPAGSSSAGSNSSLLFSSERERVSTFLFVLLQGVYLEVLSFF